MSERPTFAPLISRRDALRTAGLTAAGLLASSAQTRADDDAATTVKIAPEPLFDLSPWLYMQFMEPLGTTDGYVRALKLNSAPERMPVGQRAVMVLSLV